MKDCNEQLREFREQQGREFEQMDRLFEEEYADSWSSLSDGYIEEELPRPTVKVFDFDVDPDMKQRHWEAAANICEELAKMGYSAQEAANTMRNFGQAIQEALDNPTEIKRREPLFPGHGFDPGATGGTEVIYVGRGFDKHSLRMQQLAEAIEKRYREGTGKRMAIGIDVGHMPDVQSGYPFYDEARSLKKMAEEFDIMRVETMSEEVYEDKTAGGNRQEAFGRLFNKGKKRRY